MDFLFFASDGFMPHGYCLRWNEQLLQLFVVGNALVVFAYYSIPAALISLLRKRKDLVFNWMFVLFASFIFACGTTHLVKIWTLWNPNYWLEGFVDLFTGLISIVTAILLWPLVPRAAALPSANQLQQANEELKVEITKREAAEERIGLLASIVESSDDAIISFRLNGTVLSWNKGAQELFGYSVESTVGRTLRQLIGSDVDVAIAALKEERRLATIEIDFVRGDGQKFYLSMRVSPVRSSDGKVVGGSAIFRDVTQEKESEKELRLASEQLTQTNKELEEFAWVAAHDLKEPVRTMGTFSKLLNDEYAIGLDSQAQQFLSYIHGASVKAMDRIDDVLKFSGVIREMLEPVSVDLGDIVESVLQDLKLAIDESGAEVHVSPLPVIDGKPEYLSLLFQNLIANAIKYRSAEKPKISIDATRDGDYWKISIKDNGIGFEMEYAEKIFVMFQRLHQDDEYPGTGLGLSMCKKIVALHGGRIWCTSQKGKGATFFFTLPATRS